MLCNRLVSTLSFISLIKGGQGVFYILCAKLQRLRKEPSAKAETVTKILKAYYKHTFLFGIDAEKAHEGKLYLVTGNYSYFLK